MNRNLANSKTPNFLTITFKVCVLVEVVYLFVDSFHVFLEMVLSLEPVGTDCTNVGLRAVGFLVHRRLTIFMKNRFALINILHFEMIRIDPFNKGRGSERRRSERRQAKNFRTSKWSF